jgi:hypothetical protein
MELQLLAARRCSLLTLSPCRGFLDMQRLGDRLHCMCEDNPVEELHRAGYMRFAFGQQSLLLHHMVPHGRFWHKHEDHIV